MPQLVTKESPRLEWPLLAYQIPIASYIKSYFHSPPREQRPNRYPIPKRIWESQVFGNGVGYRSGYSTLGVLTAPEYTGLAVLPFLDTRAHLLNNNRWAANVGLGGRYLSKSHPLIVGLNAFYDYREGTYGPFNQVGAGIELIGKRLSFYGNGFTHIGKNRRKQTCVFDDYIGDYFAINRKTESSFSGFDAALSWMALEKGDFRIFATGGPYFLTGKPQSNIWGGQVSLMSQYNDYVSISVSVSHDPFFGTFIQGGLVFSLPLYTFTSLKDKEGPGGQTNRQIYQPVQRREIIPTKHDNCWDSNF